MRSLAISAVAALALLGVAACGDDETTGTAEDRTSEPTSSDTASSPSPSDTADTPDTPDAPACAEVWVDGSTLPKKYAGCLDDTDLAEDPRQPCSFGKPLVTHGDRFYAVPGGTIHETAGPLEEDPGYRSAEKSCLA